MSVMPSPVTASSPARRQISSISALPRSYASSMRCGWIRPSLTRRSSVRRPISRRTGSKHERSTASGVSSMIRLTPVTDSKARMLRPSRPMILPFISSPGRCITETTDSLVCSTATRWMASVTIFRARLSASDLAVASMSLIDSAASRLAWFSIVATSSDFAWSAVSEATRSSSALAARSDSVRAFARSSSSFRRSSSACPRSSRRRLSSSSRCSRSPIRCSRRSRSARSWRISLLTARISSSTSRRPSAACCAACSAASAALPSIRSASACARTRICSASAWTSADCSSWTAAGVPRGGNRRKTTANAPNASAKATSPITKSASAPLTVHPFRPVGHGPWRYG